MIKLYHRKNEIAIDLSGIQNPAAIEFHYTGKMYAESQLPDDWLLTSSRNKVICLSLGSSVPELMLNYTGLIHIKSGSVIDRDLNKHYLLPIVEDIDYWENMSVDFDKNTQYWEGLGSEHQIDSSVQYSSIVKNNLISESDEFYFADGTAYQGAYHQHGDGQAMTGSEHTEESELIYRKDAKGNIFDTRKGVNKERIREIMKHYQRNIPSVRGFTKSDTQKAKDIKRQVSFSEKQIDTSAPKIEKDMSVKTITRTTKTTKGY